MRRFAAILRRLSLLVAVGGIGFVAGAVTIYAVGARRGPVLEPWHTASLEGEFTAERADDVRTLDDYRQLEEQLFEELVADVYAEVDTGPTFALVRYSEGSLADPRGFDADWNRTFERIPDAPIGGALLLHGMSDSPYSLRAVGEVLFARGYRVVGLRLPGHGTAPSGLTTVDWKDMAAAVRLGMRHLRAALDARPVHIVGYSNGAALAIEHCLSVMDGSSEPMPASLVLISPSIGIGSSAALTPWLERLSALPGLEKLAWVDLLPEYDPFKYNSFAVHAGAEVYALTNALATRVQARAANGSIEGFPPTLVFLSAVDATVTADAVVDNLLEHLEPGRHELVLFDVNRASVASSVVVSDPGPLTARMIADEALPFALTLITNRDPDSDAVVAHYKTAMSPDVVTEALGVAWPLGVLSLSHVALPFPPDDPLYGRRPPERGGRLHLGQVFVQGERGLLRIPASALIRLRHNPFFEVLERRMLAWLRDAAGR